MERGFLFYFWFTWEREGIGLFWKPLIWKRVQASSFLLNFHFPLAWGLEFRLHKKDLLDYYTSILYK